MKLKIGYCKCALFLLCAFFQGKKFGVSLCAQDLDAPRFFEVNFQSLSTTASPVYGVQPAVLPGAISPNFLFDASLRFPIELGGKTKFIGQVDVQQEIMFGFWEAREAEVEDIHLYENRLSLIVMHDFNEEMRLYATFRGGSGSSQVFDFRNGAKSFNQVTLLEKRSPERKWGVGLVLSYQNRFSFLPVVKYEGPIFGKWDLDLLLPARVLLRRSINKTSRLFAGVRASSGTYLVGDNALQSDMYANTSYRRLNLKGIVGVERQISPWVGLRAEVGANLPYRSGLYDLENPRLEIHDFNQRIVPHVNLGFFLSLPK
ncbi:MAG: hypothetical protein AAFO03_11640 [Bacteroidota bacterium]